MSRAFCTSEQAQSISCEASGFHPFLSNWRHAAAEEEEINQINQGVDDELAELGYRRPSKKLSLSQAELNFDDVFGSHNEDSPRTSRSSLEGTTAYQHKTSSLSVRVTGRHPSMQLSIAEDDEEWTSELGGQLSPDTQENSVDCKISDRDLPTSQMEASCVEQAPKESTTAPMQKRIGPADFHLLCVVGQGSFGKVFQVRKKDTGQIYAMKVMRKERILEKDHAAYVWSERDVLTSLNHPYIVQMLYAFQTTKKLYLVLEFINGGHLFYQLFQEGFFLEDRARFYAAELVSAIAFLHSQGIMHRDLKPENVLLDEDGHIKVTDFGLCKENIDDSATRADSFVGTMQYMAPEIIKGEVHGKIVDWWSVGILLYEMLAGFPPFDFKTKKALTKKDRNYLMKQIVSAKISKPRHSSKQAWNLIQGLLSRDPAKRLGSGGSQEVKNHPFFKSIDWVGLEERRVPAPFKPSVAHSLCTDNFEKRFTKLPAVDSPCGTPDNPSFFSTFKGYTYTTPSLLESLAENVRDF